MVNNMFPKLVRNFIPKIIVQNEKKVAHFYTANDEEYWRKLKNKLVEEVNEFIESEDIIELADILEVIETIVIFKNISYDEINLLKKNKALSHGTFSDRIILSSIKEI